MQCFFSFLKLTYIHTSEVVNSLIFCNKIKKEKYKFILSTIFTFAKALT